MVKERNEILYEPFRISDISEKLENGNMHEDEVDYGTLFKIKTSR